LGAALGATAVSEARVAVFSSSWSRAPEGELGAAVRSLAGALSRLAAVEVFVPGDGQPYGDGAFDVTPIGRARLRAASYHAVIFDPGPGSRDGVQGEELARAIVLRAPGAPVLVVGARPAEPEIERGLELEIDGVLDVGIGDRLDVGIGDGIEPLAPSREDEALAVHPVGLYARVHPGASARRHLGLGGVPDYLLVLGDRSGAPLTPQPSDRTRWLLARFARRYVVVLEGGVARAWRSRSCVAQFDVHTRMDLWILMARAWGVVDLLPGDLYARECVEALRYGVPVVVPAASAADGLVQAGGGLRFTSTNELLSCIDALGDQETRGSLASAGREVADRWYGDPRGLVARLAAALELGRPAQSRPS
jgi:hypothetical protein